MIYASPGRRFLGFVLDFVLLGAATALMLPILGIPLEDVVDGVAPPSFEITTLLLAAVYQIGFITWRGQTPGKMAVRIKVVDEQSPALPTISAATVRWLIPAAAQFIPQVGLIAVIVVYGWLLIDPKRQGIHDKAARTVVIDLLLAVDPPPDLPPEDVLPPGPVES